MKKNTIYYCLILLAIYSCREEKQVNKIGGALYQDCTHRLSNAEVALKANIGADFGDPLILGTGITNGQGEFYFTYELEEDDEGTADLLLINSNGFETLIKDLKLNLDQSLLLFRNNQSSVLIELSGTKVYTSNDTLFYGIDVTDIESFKVQPSNGFVDTLEIMSSNTVSGKTDATFYYGLGAVEYNLAKEALGIPDSSFQQISLELKGCNAPDTAQVIIN